MFVVSLTKCPTFGLKWSLTRLCTFSGKNLYKNKTRKNFINSICTNTFAQNKRLGVWYALTVVVWLILSWNTASKRFFDSLKCHQLRLRKLHPLSKNPIDCLRSNWKKYPIKKIWHKFHCLEITCPHQIQTKLTRQIVKIDRCNFCVYSLKVDRRWLL